MKLSHNSVTKIKYIFLDNTEKSAIDCETQAEEQVKIFKKDTEFRYRNPTKKVFLWIYYDFREKAGCDITQLSKKTRFSDVLLVTFFCSELPPFYYNNRSWQMTTVARQKNQYKKVETTAERMGQIEEEADQEVSRSP